MLKGIDPLLTPQLLMVLADMGHGDEIVVADANFTASSIARSAPSLLPVIRVPGAGSARMVQAILSLMALDTAVSQPFAFMHVCNQAAEYRSGLQREVMADVHACGAFASQQSAEAVERFAFYERARKASAIVLTGETQPYGNFILKKGVIGEALRP